MTVLTILRIASILLSLFYTSYADILSALSLTGRTAPLQKRARDWTHQIRCIGYVPDYLQKAYARDGSEVTWDTPRSMCAKTDYGGKPGVNYGGYCAYYSYRDPHLFFDSASMRFRVLAPNPQGRLTPEENRRDTNMQETLHQSAYSFCQLRCRCLSDHAILTGRRSEWPAAEVSESEPPSEDYYDKTRLPAPIYAVETRLAPALRNIPRLNILHLAEDASSIMEMVVATILPSSVWFRPSCVNKFPNTVPFPFRRSDFSTTRELCANYFHGGLEAGNAGFVCSVDEENPARRKLHLMEHLAHPSMILANHSPGIAINYWCRSICICNIDDSREQDPIPIDNIEGLVGRDLVAFFENGNINIRHSDGSDPPDDVPARMGIPNYPELDDTCDASSVGAESKQCKSVTLTFKPSSSPLDTVKSLFLQKTPPAAGGNDQCKKSCDGPGQCGSSCICVSQLSSESSALMPNYNDEKAKGLAFCMSLGLISAHTAQRMSKFAGRSGRQKRSLPEGSAPNIGLVEGFLCPCNSTYSAEHCCELDLRGF